MSRAEEKMRTLLANTAARGMPTQDLAELLEANLTGNLLESVMRVRALTELSSLLDSATLMALTAVVVRRGGLVADMVWALDSPRH